MRVGPQVFESSDDTTDFRLLWVIIIDRQWILWPVLLVFSVLHELLCVLRPREGVVEPLALCFGQPAVIVVVADRQHREGLFESALKLLDAVQKLLDRRIISVLVHFELVA